MGRIRVYESALVVAVIDCMAAHQLEQRVLAAVEGCLVDACLDEVFYSDGESLLDLLLFFLLIFFLSFPLLDFRDFLLLCCQVCEPLLLRFVCEPLLLCLCCLFFLVFFFLLQLLPLLELLLAALLEHLLDLGFLLFLESQTVQFGLFLFFLPELFFLALLPLFLLLLLFLLPLLVVLFLSPVLRVLLALVCQPLDFLLSLFLAPPLFLEPLIFEPLLLQPVGLLSLPLLFVESPLLLFSRLPLFFFDSQPLLLDFPPLFLDPLLLELQLGELCVSPGLLDLFESQPLQLDLLSFLQQLGRLVLDLAPLRFLHLNDFRDLGSELLVSLPLLVSLQLLLLETALLFLHLLLHLDVGQLRVVGLERGLAEPGGSVAGRGLSVVFEEQIAVVEPRGSSVSLLEVWRWPVLRRGWSRRSRSGPLLQLQQPLLELVSFLQNRDHFLLQMLQRGLVLLIFLFHRIASRGLAERGLSAPQLAVSSVWRGRHPLFLHLGLCFSGAWLFRGLFAEGGVFSGLVDWLVPGSRGFCGEVLRTFDLQLAGRRLPASPRRALGLLLFYRFRLDCRKVALLFVFFLGDLFEGSFPWRLVH